MLGERYKLGSVIGSGGMSEVFEAEDLSLGRQVAIKMLRPEMARDVNFRERFRKEAQNAGRLNHPNIVSIYDTGESEWEGIEVPYIVMELVHGRTLRDLVRGDGPLSLDEAAEILIPVAQALQASHEAGIIHRDVKPANIMLTNTGQVKVMDFGIARALDDSTAAMTQTSAVIGTAQYLSPEQARGKAADARSDVYALGCVLYETVTGRTPFEGETPFAVAYQHVQEEPTPPSTYIKGLSQTQRVNIDAVVLTAMAKHPADRYQSAWEMAEDLGRLSRGSVTKAAKMHVHDSAAQAPAAPATSILGQAVPPRQRAPQAAPQQPVAAPPPRQHYAEEPDGGAGALKWIASALAVILIGAISFFAWDFFSHSDYAKDRDRGQQSQQGDMVTVPDVEGRPRERVQKELEDLGLLVQVNQESNPKIKRNDVIRANPAAGSELQRNSTVVLTVSSGKEVTEVPDLRGKTLEEAEKILKDAHLELDGKITEKYDSTVEKDEIFEQSPVSGSQISQGSKVRVTVSKGVDTVRVSHVQGMTLEDARETLEEQGLKVEFNVVDSAQPEGHVVSVSNQGEEVPVDETIQLEVSNGMLIQVPDLVRMSEEQARRALTRSGWTGTFRIGETVDTPSPLDDGLIAWSSAEPGDLIRRDQSIDIRTWKLISFGIL